MVWWDEDSGNDMNTEYEAYPVLITGWELNHYSHQINLHSCCSMPPLCATPWHADGEAELQEGKGSLVAVIFLEVIEAWLQLFCHG